MKVSEYLREHFGESAERVKGLDLQGEVEFSDVRLVTWNMTCGHGKCLMEFKQEPNNKVSHLMGRCQPVYLVRENDGLALAQSA